MPNTTRSHPLHENTDMTLHEMLRTHPRSTTVDAPELEAAISALQDCVVTCSICADTCLHEDDVDPMRRRIQTDLDCADLCTATLRILSRPGSDATTWYTAVTACVDVCTTCADECAGHDHEHCQICARSCRTCAKACRTLLAAAN